MRELGPHDAFGFTFVFSTQSNVNRNEDFYTVSPCIFDYLNTFRILVLNKRSKYTVQNIAKSL